MTNVDEILGAIQAEREKHSDLPGSEWDLRNAPNDWIAIASRYLSECARRGANLPAEDEFRDSLIKAAAVIVTAVGHIPRMSTHNHFSKKK